MLIAVRFGLYLDLMLVFGLPLFCLYTFKGAEQRASGQLVSSGAAIGLSLAGVALSVIGLLLLAASMSDVPVFQLDRETIDAVANQTATGTAGKVRLAAVVVTLPVIAFTRRAVLSQWIILSCLGAVALGSLAWSGHGAADEGVLGTAHLVADIAHLLAAGIWVGALVGLPLLLRKASTRLDGQDNRMKLARDALVKFGTVGSFAVALIVLTGLVNSWFLVGTEHVLTLPNAVYGRLLILKLVTFVGMIGLAARNRFVLTPAITPYGNKGGERAFALSSISRSVALEGSLALFILGLVAWLGTLPSPNTSL